MSLDDIEIKSQLKKAMRLCSHAKKNIQVNQQKANKYFKKSLNILDNLKNFDEISQLVQTTEAECMKNIKYNIFNNITESDIDKIKKYNKINFREINEDGNTVLHHAIKVGDVRIMKELLKKGGKIDQVNGNGHSLLEYACLKKDPNIINVLIQHGANMRKHLFFRKGGEKYYLNKCDIDLAIILKIIIIKSFNNIDEENFVFLKHYFNVDELVGIQNFTIKNIIIGLHNMFDSKSTYDSFKTIIVEELDDYNSSIKDNKSCPYKKIDIILINLVPFINYPFNLACSFILKPELKFLIKNILKDNKKNYKNLLMNNLFDIYIKNNLFTEDYIGILVYQIISKIKL